MKTHNPIHKLLIPMLSLGLVTFGALPALKAQEQSTNSTNSTCSAKEGRKHHKGELRELTQPEREQFKAAMEKVKNSPELTAARQAVEQAQTKEAKKAAHHALEQTRHDLLLKADPTIQPVLDKLPKHPRGEGGEIESNETK